MNNDISQIIEEQSAKLPTEIRDFLASSGWDVALDSIVEKFAITGNVRVEFHNEILIILLGLMHPDAFRGEIEKFLLTRAEIIDAIVAEVEEKIFVPIRPSLIAFFESERATAEAEQVMPSEYSSEALVEAPTPGQIMLLEKTSDTPPENLPIEKTMELPFLKLIPKVSTPDDQSIHPFEEKMKIVFTSAPAYADTGSLPLATQEEIPTPPQILSEQNLSEQAAINLRHDPYREAVE